MDTDTLAVRIVDHAIAMGEELGWENVRLRVVAERLEIPLAEVMLRFRDLDAVADFWFRIAWEAMLAVTPDAHQTSPADRIERMLMRWFEALGPHRTLTGQMLRAKPTTGCRLSSTFRAPSIG